MSDNILTPWQRETAEWFARAVPLEPVRAHGVLHSQPISARGRHRMAANDARVEPDNTSQPGERA